MKKLFLQIVGLAILVIVVNTVVVIGVRTVFTESTEAQHKELFGEYDDLEAEDAYGEGLWNAPGLLTCIHKEVICLDGAGFLCRIVVETGTKARAVFRMRSKTAQFSHLDHVVPGDRLVVRNPYNSKIAARRYIVRHQDTLKPKEN